jgi:hypothetical protein
MKRVAILQSNYVPWRGYFDLIDSVDEFVLYDDVQYTRRDWRNRNLIKTPDGVRWLTVPVQVKGKYYQAIRDTRVDGTAWAQTHWRALQQNYARSGYFAAYEAELRGIYLGTEYTHLSVLNETLLAWCMTQLRVTTDLTSSAGYELASGRSERLLSICLQAGAGVYVSGPAAKSYLDEEMFSAAGVAVEWYEYPEYPEYPQLWGGFEPRVSILDVLFNCGPGASEVALRRDCHA